MPTAKWHQERTNALVSRIRRDAWLSVQGLKKPTGTLGSNSDGGKPFDECRTVTQNALLLTYGSRKAAEWALANGLPPRDAVPAPLAGT